MSDSHKTLSFVKKKKTNKQKTRGDVDLIVEDLPNESQLVIFRMYSYTKQIEVWSNLISPDIII